MGEYVSRSEAERPAPNETSFPGAGSYIAAALLPIVGVILAVVALARSRTGLGLALLATSALAFAVWAYLLV